MKARTWGIALVLALALVALVAAAPAAFAKQGQGQGPGQGQCTGEFVDEDGDGVCDNAGQRAGQNQGTGARMIPIRFLNRKVR